MGEPTIKTAFNRVIAIATAASSCLGFVADVLQPIAPFAKYLFVFALLCLVTFIVIAVRSGWQRAGVGVLVSVVAAVVLGVLVAAQAFTSSKLGFLAEAIPAIQELQEKLPLPEPPPMPEKLPPPPGPPPFPGFPGKP